MLPQVYPKLVLKQSCHGRRRVYRSACPVASSAIDVERLLAEFGISAMVSHRHDPALETVVFLSVILWFVLRRYVRLVMTYPRTKALKERSVGNQGILLHEELANAWTKSNSWSHQFRQLLRSHLTAQVGSISSRTYCRRAFGPYFFVLHILTPSLWTQCINEHNGICLRSDRFANAWGT